jgi:TPP-dependent indolepyruvate ferredoxin oxidoreductase alpha subunit
MVPNPDFANRFTNNAEQFYSEKEATKQGMPKLAEHITTLKKNKIEHKKKERAKALFEGNQTAGVKKQLEKLGIKK